MVPFSPLQLYLTLPLLLGLLSLLTIIIKTSSVKETNKNQHHQHVDLEVYIESGCPVSQAFLLGELTNVLSLSDIVAIVHFKYIPFGNTFFNETLNTYQCYDEVECETDATQLCAMYQYDPANDNNNNNKKKKDKDAGKEGQAEDEDELSVILTGKNSYPTFPFISCMEANQGLYTFAESCWNSSMYSTGLSSTPWEEIKKCSEEEFLKVMTAGDLGTPQWLTTVPLVLVDSVQYNTSDGNLLQTICKAYTGFPRPSSCSI